jgi:hypothetical protein
MSDITAQDVDRYFQRHLAEVRKVYGGNVQLSVELHQFADSGEFQIKHKASLGSYGDTESQSVTTNDMEVSVSRATRRFYEDKDNAPAKIRLMLEAPAHIEAEDTPQERPGTTDAEDAEFTPVPDYTPPDPDGHL